MIPTPTRILHTCGCVLMRKYPESPFHCCPVHGSGQQAIGAVLVHDALHSPQPRPWVPEGPRPSTSRGAR